MNASRLEVHVLDSSQWSVPLVRLAGRASKHHQRGHLSALDALRGAWKWDGLWSTSGLLPWQWLSSFRCWYGLARRQFLRVGGFGGGVPLSFNSHEHVVVKCKHEGINLAER